MTTPSGRPIENHFTLRGLPGWVGAGSLLVWLITLNHWISLNSLGTVARISGWLWQPEIGRPLTLLVYTPFRLLPGAWLPLVLNLATAVCAALTLGQLARSLAILHYDVAPTDPMRKTKSGPPLLTGSLAWLPPVFAALVCGLQLGFWEHATSASGEMLSLLCFAFALRCLLEFRLDPQQKWLSRCVLVFAVGMTDNWLMVGYLPMVVAGIIWVKGYTACLNLRFLGQMAFWALLGLSLYLVIPFWLSVTAPDQWDFWPALKAQLVAQKNALQIFRVQAFRLLALTALLPFLLLAVRWRSHTVQLADDSRFGVFFAKATGHFIHGLFFVTAVWITLDPALTPRQAELKSPLLPYHYTWALVAGYGMGYLLLFARPRSSRPPERWPAYVALLLLGLLPATLIWKNLGDIRLTNGRVLREFARQIYDDLPPGKATVLSDEIRPLLLLRAELAAQGREKNPLLVDTRSLPWPDYHRHLQRNHGLRWPDVLSSHNGETASPAQLLALVRQIATNEPLVYLHPSSGFFLEDFTAAPHGWIQRLEERRRGTLPVADTSDPASARNDQRWQERWAAQLAARAAQFEASRERAARWLLPPLKSFKLASRTNETATMLAGVYSKMLNHWGVQAQQHGRAGAAEWFRRALAFDPDNLAAHINLESAARRQKGEPARLPLAWVREAFPKLLSRFERWADVIGRNGPVDEPTFLLHTGRMYLAARNPRQAETAFARSAALAPKWIAPKLWQAQSQNLLGNFTAALALTDGLPGPNPQLKGPGLAQLLQIRAVALHRTGQTNEAAGYIEHFVADHLDKTGVIVAAAELCAYAGNFPAELKWRELLLQREPDRVEWLVKKGQTQLRLADFKAAHKTMTLAVTLAPMDGSARLFRAIAALQSGYWDEARRDYEELLKKPDLTQSALFGLGGLAWRERDTNAMIQYYQAFLSNNAAATPQAAVANQRLKEWQDE